MKWKYETEKERKDRLKQWRKWFAWYPVDIDGYKYWLCYVERSDYTLFYGPFTRPFWVTDYREYKNE